MRPGPARDALQIARATSAYTDRTGVPLDEAADAVAGLSRRRLLKGAAIALAASAVPIAVDAKPAAAKTQPTVAIIGAGAAGLGVAYRLHRRYGIAARVYEWDDRVGGRIRTLRGHFAGGQLIEEHAEFINPEHTSTLALAKRFGLQLDNTDHYPEPNQDQESYRFNAKNWPQHEVNHDWHSFGRRIMQQACAAAPFPTLYTQSTAAGRHYDQLSVIEWLDRHIPGGSAGDFGRLCIAAVVDEYGGAPQDQSALNLIYLLGEDASTDSGNQPKSAPALGGADEKWHLKGGNDQLTNGLLHRLPTGSVHLGEKLVSVRARGNSGYVLTLHHGQGSRVVHADHVVLALPFTTLRHVDLDRAGISALHLKAIRHEPLGSNAKFFVQVANRVWDQAGKTGNAYCDGVVQGAWDATGYQSGSTGILAALPGGDVGTDWGSTYGLRSYRGTPPAHMVNAYLDEFDQLFPGVKAAYNGRAFYVWSAGDPHIRGAYSYLKVGQYTGFNGIQSRREGNLHFAGEHTSINFQGYIEGALRSGYRCADEIAGG